MNDKMQTAAKEKTATKTNRKAGSGRSPVRSAAPAPWLGATRSGADKAKIRAANARMAKHHLVGLNPYRFSTTTISENDYYSLAIFALRYAMGGGTIGQSAVIGEVISAVGFSNLGERIASVIVPEYEDYVRRFNEGDESKVSERWRRCYRWLKALRDDAFTLVHVEWTTADGKPFLEDIVAFTVDGKWVDAKYFVTNQIADIYINPSSVFSTEPFHWKDLLEEGNRL